MRALLSWRGHQKPPPPPPGGIGLNIFAIFERIITEICTSYDLFGFVLLRISIYEEKEIKRNEKQISDKCGPD